MKPNHTRPKVDFPATGSNIKRLRQTHHMSLIDVVHQIIGLTPVHLEKVEQGEEKLDLNLLVSLANLFGVKPSQILAIINVSN